MAFRTCNDCRRVFLADGDEQTCLRCASDVEPTHSPTMPEAAIYYVNMNWKMYRYMVRFVFSSLVIGLSIPIGILLVFLYFTPVYTVLFGK